MRCGKKPSAAICYLWTSYVKLRIYIFSIGLRLARDVQVPGKVGGRVMSDTVGAVLNTVIADLVPAPGVSTDALGSARRAAAVATITGQQSVLLTRTSPIATP